jgi:hypothetical protein
MKLLYKAIATLLLTLAVASTHAGSPDDLQLLILGSPAAAAHQPRIAQYFKDYEADPTGFDCDGHQLNIGAAFQAPLKTVTPEMARKSLSDPKQRRALGKAMEKFRSPEHDRGFDGALFYDLQEGELIMYGISTRSKRKILASSIPVSDASNRAKFNLAICRALLMPALQAP